MLAIGRALMARPRCLTLDEPSVGLAPNLVAQVLEAITAIRETGVTVLIVEQNAAQALAISDRAYVIESGSIVLEGRRPTWSTTRGCARRTSGSEAWSSWSTSRSTGRPTRRRRSGSGSSPQELEAGQRLAHAGQLRRLWRIPGRWANWSLYDVADATELHAALSSLPLYPWMDIEVHPLAEHPNDPGLLGIDPTHVERRRCGCWRSRRSTSRRRGGRRQARYDGLAPAGLRVVVRCAARAALETGSDDDIAASEAVLVTAFAAEAGASTRSCPTACSTRSSTTRPSLPRPVYGIGTAGRALPGRARAVHWGGGPQRADRRASWTAGWPATAWPPTADDGAGPVRRGHRRRRRLGGRGRPPP